MPINKETLLNLFRVLPCILITVNVSSSQTDNKRKKITRNSVQLPWVFVDWIFIGSTGRQEYPPTMVFEKNLRITQVAVIDRWTTMIVLYALTVFSVCAFGFLVFRLKSSRFLRLTDKLPGPKRYALLGNFPDLMCDDGSCGKIVCFTGFSFNSSILFQKRFSKRYANGAKLMDRCIIFPARTSPLLTSPIQRNLK